MKRLTQFWKRLRRTCSIKGRADAIDRANKQMDIMERHIIGRAHMDGDDRFCILRRPPNNGGCDS
jgi:hypothetical protein